jgi:hypothetical protein
VGRDTGDARAFQPELGGETNRYIFGVAGAAGKDVNRGSPTERRCPMKTSLLALSVLAFASTVALAADPAPAAGPRSSCKADVASLCAGVQPGAGRIAACLKQNAEKVSPACKDALARARDRKAQSKTGSAQ